MKRLILERQSHFLPIFVTKCRYYHNCTLKCQGGVTSGSKFSPKSGGHNLRKLLSIASIIKHIEEGKVSLRRQKPTTNILECISRKPTLK